MEESQEQIERGKNLNGSNFYKYLSTFWKIDWFFLLTFKYSIFVVIYSDTSDPKAWLATRKRKTPTPPPEQRRRGVFEGRRPIPRGKRG